MEKGERYNEMRRFAAYISDVFTVAVQEGMTYAPGTGGLRRGGYVCLVESDLGGTSSIRRMIGDVPPMSGYREACETVLQSARASKAASTWEDGDRPSQKRGVAVLMDAGEFIAVFIGLEKEVNEAVLLATGVLLEHITQQQLERVLSISNNSKFQQLIEACKKTLTML